MSKLPPIADVRTGLYSRLAELPEDDLRVLAAIVAELPHARLVAACEAETAKGIEGPGTPVRTGPTSRRVAALAELLGAFDRWRALVGLKPRAVRGVEGVLREGRRRWMSAVLTTVGGKDA